MLDPYIIQNKIQYSVQNVPSNRSYFCKSLQLHTCEQPLPNKLDRQGIQALPFLDWNPGLHSGNVSICQLQNIKIYVLLHSIK